MASRGGRLVLVNSIVNFGAVPTVSRHVDLLCYWGFTSSPQAHQLPIFFIQEGYSQVGMLKKPVSPPCEGWQGYVNISAYEQALKKEYCHFEPERSGGEESKISRSRSFC